MSVLRFITVLRERGERGFSAAWRRRREELSPVNVIIPVITVLRLMIE